MDRTTEEVFDFAVIGAGIAGASIAAGLASGARVLLLEAEAQPGYHTTGRSAAVFAPNYGPAPIRALTRASQSFFQNPSDGFTDTDLLSPRQIMMLAGKTQTKGLDRLRKETPPQTNVRHLSAAQTQAAHPLLRPSYAAGAMLDTGGFDIDVHGLHHGFLRRFHAAGGTLETGVRLDYAKFQNDHWHLEAGDNRWQARTVVNAAGAWGDEIAALFGTAKVGLWPLRRTALLINAPDGTDVDALPLTVDVDEQFYMKPDAGRLLISPANQDLSPPCDVQPDEMDVAICIDRIQGAFELSITRIEHKWAGLRSFVSDKCPVFGFATDIEGFYWAAGQGGYGIQTAPALARLAVAQLTGAPLPIDIQNQGLDPLSICPTRLKDTE